MELKEKLKELKLRILDLPNSTNRGYEFEAELKDHPIGNQHIYKLHYVQYYRMGERYGWHENNIGMVDWPCSPFMLPEKMSREDAFKVLSYLTDFVEAKLHLRPCSYQSVSTLDGILNLERLGFTRPHSDPAPTEVLSLFTVDGRVQLFKKSRYYRNYFEWYTENVTLDEVKDIYQRCGIEFYDVKFNNRQFVKK